MHEVYCKTYAKHAEVLLFSMYGVRYSYKQLSANYVIENIGARNSFPCVLGFPNRIEECQISRSEPIRRRSIGS